MHTKVGYYSVSALRLLIIKCAAYTMDVAMNLTKKCISQLHKYISIVNIDAITGCLPSDRADESKIMVNYRALKVYKRPEISRRTHHPPTYLLPKFLNSSMKYTILNFLSAQFALTPPVLKRNLQGKTAIIIGANAGIGFETAKHFASMGVSRLVLACRNRERGEAARKGWYMFSTSLVFFCHTKTTLRNRN